MTQWGLDTLFNPGKRHMDEEKRRLQSTRQQIGDSSGGKRIDLESGKVTIRRSSAPTDEDAEDADEGAAAPVADANQSGEASSDALEVAGPPRTFLPRRTPASRLGFGNRSQRTFRCRTRTGAERGRRVGEAGQKSAGEVRGMADEKRTG